jgi:hypothetical protein
MWMYNESINILGLLLLVAKKEPLIGGSETCLEWGILYWLCIVWVLSIVSISQCSIVVILIGLFVQVYLLSIKIDFVLTVVAVSFSSLFVLYQLGFPLIMDQDSLFTNWETKFPNRLLSVFSGKIDI